MPADPNSLENIPQDKRDAMAVALNRLLNNADPEVVKGTKRLLMKMEPSIKYADVEVEDRLSAFEQKQAEREAAKEASDRKAEQTRLYETVRAKVISQGFKIEEVEALMVEKKIGDYDTAMEHLRFSKELAPPTPDSLVGQMEMPANMGDMMKGGLHNFRIKAGHEALNEIMRKRTA